MAADDSWRKEATALQRKYAVALQGLWDLQQSDSYKLKTQIGIGVCGVPTRKPNNDNNRLGWSKSENDQIIKIYDQIIKQSGSFPIKFAKTVVLLRNGDKCCRTTVFRIITKEGHSIFIDHETRVYKDWNSYTEENTLPKTECCYPVNGDYSKFSAHRTPVIFAETPACKLLNKGTDALDSLMAAGTVVGGAAVMVGAASFATPVAVGSGAYALLRGAATLCDRRKHKMSLTDRDARKSWYSVASPIIAMATAAAVKSAEKAIEGGKAVPKVLKIFSKTTSVASVAISGFGFVDTLYICYKKKDRLTKYDWFCIACESMFFYNSILSAKHTWELMHRMADPVQACQNADAEAMSNCVSDVALQILGDATQLSTFELMHSLGMGNLVFTCESIAHDTLRLRRGEMSLLLYLRNTATNIKSLYDNLMPTIGELFKTVLSWISTLGQALKSVFDDNVENAKRFFGLKVSNASNQLNDAKLEANSKIAEVVEPVDEKNSDSTNKDGNGLNPEIKDVLNVVVNLIDKSVFSASDLKDFSDILDASSNHISKEFKKKIEMYTKGLKAYKDISGDKWDANAYNEAMGIRGSAADHFFRETVEEAMTDRGIYMIRSKMEQLRNELPGKITQVSHLMDEGMFYYSFSTKEASLKAQLIGSIGKILGTSLSENTVEWHEYDDFISVTLLDDADTTINVYNEMLTEQTANGLIMIV